MKGSTRRGAARRPSTTALLVFLAGMFGGPRTAAKESRAGTMDEIAGAIERGREALLPRLGAQAERFPRDYPMGRISLSLAAVLKAGAPPGHPAVLRALAALEKLRPEETYSVALSLLALDAHWQALFLESIPAKPLAGGTGPLPPVPPQGPVRARMEELVSWLTKGSGGVWSYGGRYTGDLSNTQFALLGLDVALENGIPVPDEVFLSLAQAITGARSPALRSARVRIAYESPAWRGVTAPSTRHAERAARPRGWNYEMNAGFRASPSMTAAGLSSLLIARKGLRRARASTPPIEEAIEDGIICGLAWIAKHRMAFPADYYALYSLEKAMDIAGISALDGCDWYALGALHLLEKQGEDGLWGDEVDTSFALLFLTHATRSRLHALGPPVFITPRSGDGELEATTDLVFISAAGGFLPTPILFEFAEASRDPKLLPILDEALKACPPHAAHEVLQRVLYLWAEDDTLTRWARAAAASLTGLEQGSRAEYLALVGDLEGIRLLEKEERLDGPRLASLLAKAKGTVLQRRLLDLVDRHGEEEAFGRVIDLLGDRDAGVRRRALDVLTRWTGLTPGEAGGKAGGRGDVEDVEKTASPWREWWAENGDDFVAGRRVAKLIGAIGRETSPERREAALRAIISEGARAVDPILEAMEGGGFSVHLVRALEEITGERRGLRAADWRSSR